MAHTSQIFDRQPVQVQNLNGFDLSHLFAGTAITGKLTPCLLKLIMPGTNLSIGVNLQVELPPLATSFFGKVDAVIELFNCPCAVLYGGWKQFISNQVATMFPTSQDTVQQNGGYLLPVLDAGNSALAGVALSYDSTFHGLADYLGIRLTGAADAGGSVYRGLWNLLPFLAYHKIWDTFYRNPSTTRTVFAVNPDWQNTSSGIAGEAGLPMGSKNVSLVWHSFYAAANYSYTGSAAPGGTTFTTGNNIFVSSAEYTFPDSVTIFEMRQRCWSRDYFTAASVNPQQGNPGTVVLNVDPGTSPSPDTVSLSIPAIRSINALQKFREASNWDPSYRGIMRNHFGVSPSDADLDEPSYIGRLVVPVYQKGVYQSSGNYDTDTGMPIGAVSRNPFVAAGAMGAKGAHGGFSGEGRLCSRYKINCFSYLMGIFSLVPHAMYGYGINREMFASQIGDFPFPELQTVGMDEILTKELYYGLDSTTGAANNTTFAYIPRYSRFKYIDDRIAGAFRPGKSMSMFVLQRIFSQAPQFGTDFVTIPENALDNVFATDATVSNVSCWFEVFWNIKAVMPLAAFCVPTLGDLRDTHTQYTTQGGSRL